ncbi:MAG: hypothetical protein LRZ88_02720 [Candidatus Cloacimonetes bacterium]|nr:hypothetical protein [Candidatus Cloacimonadota bacterium]
MIILVCLALYACAGVDASVMDTAETLGRGKFSVSNTFTMGINFPGVAGDGSGGYLFE